MSGRVVPFSAGLPKQAMYSILSCAIPGVADENAGVLLIDPASDSLYIKLRRDWDEFASEEDAEVLTELEQDLTVWSREEGAQAVLARLEDIASGALRVTDLEAITVRNFDRTLAELYSQHVRARVLPFRTHLPRYSLAVAAGPFLTNPEDVTAEEWVEVPEALHPNADMFIARIQGQSMEPKIPDGSLCVFNRNVVGSRQGRLVLVRNSELADDNQYTVKRYKSEKRISEEGWQQARIRLESLNPEFPSWDLDEDAEKYQVIAEFVRVLE